MSARPDPIVSRKINREIVVLIGWGRAILLQLAHPLIAAAVRDNSTFHSGASGYARRAYQTIGAMLDLTFGTPDEAQRIVDRINGIHDRINGRLATATGVHAAGTRYSARDARLLIWVHATLVDSLVVTYEALAGPLTIDEKNKYAAESAWLAGELGAPRAEVPADYAGVEALMREMRTEIAVGGEIAIGSDARMMAMSLLAPPVGIASPVFWITRLMTIGLLPADYRDAYEFEWPERRERAFQRTASLIRGARRLLPRMLREWPAARRVEGYSAIEGKGKSTGARA